jgi:hypothetical protein
MYTHMKKTAAGMVDAAAPKIRVVEVSKGFVVHRMCNPAVVARSAKLGVLSVRLAYDYDMTR